MTHGQAAKSNPKRLATAPAPEAAPAKRSVRPLVSEAALAAAIRSVTRRELLPFSIALGLYFLLACIGYALLRGTEPEWALSATAGGSALVCFLIALLAYHSSLGSKFVHMVSALLGTLALLNFLAPSVSSGNPPQTIHLMALLIGAGAVLLSWEWLTLLGLMTWFAWFSTLQLSGSNKFSGPPWQSPEATALGAATLAAGLIFGFRFRYVANAQRMRLVRQQQFNVAEPVPSPADRRAEFLPSFAEATTEATVTHEHGRILDVSSKLTRLLGYENAQLAGRNLLDLFAKDSRSQLATALRLGNLQTLATVAIHRDGTIVPVELESRQGAGIRPTVRVMTFRDLSENARVAHEKAEQERQTRCEMALAGMDISFDQPGELPTFLNQIAALAGQMLHTSGGAFILLRDANSGTLSPISNTLGQDVNAAALKRFARNEGATRWVTENGQPLFVSCAKNDPFWSEADLIRDSVGAYGAVPLRAERETLGILFVVEETPRTYQSTERNFLASLANRATLAMIRIRLFEQMRSANQQLEYQRAELQVKNIELAEAKEFAENASRSKSDFLSTISHELRTPMNGVLGMLSLLQTTELTSEQSEFIGTAQGSADGLLAIINEVLDFSKIELGQLHLRAAPFAPKAFFTRSVEAFGILAREKALPINLELAPDLPESLQADAERLRQILSILVRNAIKYTERGSVTVRFHGRHLSDQNYELRIEVADTGIGITPEVRPKLFFPFSQADGSLTRVYGGIGLGLAIAKQLVTLMHGNISVESTPGQGSTFRVTVPLAIAPAV